MLSTRVSPFLVFLSLGCGGKVVFVGDAEGSAGQGGEGGARPVDSANGWRPDCPGYFGGPFCPEHCPIVVPNDVGTYCTEKCDEATATGCGVGAVCNQDQCALGPCEDHRTCPGDTECGSITLVCIPRDDLAAYCGPFVSTADRSCEYPCNREVPLPDGATLCTNGCNEETEFCTAGSTCRTDFPSIEEFYDVYPCLPLCFTDEDCPAGLRCDDLGQCSAP